MPTVVCPVCLGSRKDILVSGQVCVRCGGNGYIRKDDQYQPRRRGKLTVKDIISLLVLIGTIIGFILYIFSQ